LQKVAIFFDRSNLPEGFKQFQLDCPSSDKAAMLSPPSYVRVTAK